MSIDFQQYQLRNAVQLACLLPPSAGNIFCRCEGKEELKENFTETKRQYLGARDLRSS